MQGNHLTGPIPDTFGDLKALEWIRVFGASLWGGKGCAGGGVAREGLTGVQGMPAALSTSLVAMQPAGRSGDRRTQLQKQNRADRLTLMLPESQTTS